jgi:outer membrane protein OmpA-like peptidoglycan-associated protein
MSRFLVLVLAVAACHARPPVQDPVIAQRTEAPTGPTTHVEVETPDWVPRQRGRVVVTQTTMTVFEDLRFLPGAATIDPKTTPILDVFAQSMIDNPSLQLIVVRIFAADVSPHFQRIVAELRARNVVDYVVARGVDRSRLRPEGIPLPPPGSNDRLQFEIVQRAP